MTQRRTGYYAMLRRRCAALGMCTTCRKAPRTDGGSKCGACRDRQHAYMDALRASKTPGRCAQCRRRAKDGRRECAPCLDGGRMTSIHSRTKRVASMRCVKCGSPIAHAGIQTCSRCHEQDRFRSMLARVLRHG